MKYRKDILEQAAEHIEKHPERFNFWHGMKPSSEQGKGCALAWVGYFAESEGTFSSNIAPEVLGVSEAAFYERMGKFESFWSASPEQTVECLRFYAEEYEGEG